MCKLAAAPQFPKRDPSLRRQVVRLTQRTHFERALLAQTHGPPQVAEIFSVHANYDINVPPCQNISLDVWADKANPLGTVLFAKYSAHNWLD